MSITAQDFSVKLSYHPKIHVPSLEAAEHFYSRVFGRASTNLSVIMPQAPAPGHSVDHSTYTSISDVLIDTLAPGRYLTRGTQRFADVEAPLLKSTGWYVENVKELYKALRAEGIRLVDSHDQLLLDDEWAGGPSPFLTMKDDAGLQYSFFELFNFPLDPRLKDGWSIPEVGDADPLGIEHASHHTILTSLPERALKLTVGILGGEVIGTGRDELRGVSGPFVRLAGSTYHFATPDSDSGSASTAATNEPFDTYHAITWKVQDIKRTARHLEAEGVRIAHQSETSLVTDPATSLGIPWGFTESSVPNHGQ